VIIFCLCRIGFEKEVAAEISAIAARHEVSGFVNAKADSGFVKFICHDADAAQSLVQTVPFEELVFIRHWFVVGQENSGLDVADRVTPLISALQAGPPCCDIQAIFVDTNEGKSLSKLSTSIAGHIDRYVKKKGSWKRKSLWRAQLLFLAGDHGVLGWAPVENMSPWLGGIPRLKLPREAPSRATLKLEEAWLHFIPKSEMDTRLRPGMRAVDLGAAPGGWTWQLVNKSMFVDAVDNGPMDARLIDSGQITHHETDGFRYTPEKPVDWLVCDIADKPMRVVNMINRWAVNGWFGEAVFNLKLPMKQRFNLVEQAKGEIAEVLKKEGFRYRLRFKQLYTDREEVTGHLRILSRKS